MAKQLLSNDDNNNITTSTNAEVSCKEQSSHMESSNNDSIRNNTIIDEFEWTCTICNVSLQQHNRDSHFANCVKVYGHKRNHVRDTQNESPSSPFTCDICKVDITHLSVQERCEHINKCLDAERVNIEQNNVPHTQNVTIIECPVCLKNFSNVKDRFAHIKKCCIAMEVDVPSVIVPLQLQQKHTIEGLSLSLPPLQKKSVTTRTIKRLPKKTVKEPKSQADADLQLAKALSLSELKSLKNDEKAGKNRKKNINIPLLVLRTDEDRQKLLQERVSSIVALQHSVECDASNSKVFSQECRLWTLSGVAEKNESYYVQQLREFIIPYDIEMGSKFRSLTQVPFDHQNLHTATL